MFDIFSQFMSFYQESVLFCIAVNKLMELHGEGKSTGGKGGDQGKKVERGADNYEPPVLDSV